MRNNHTDEAVSYTLLQFGKLSGKVKLKKRSKRQKSLHYINSLYKIINKNYFLFLHIFTCKIRRTNSGRHLPNRLVEVASESLVPYIL